MIYDAMGSRNLHRSFLRPLLKAGGRAFAFLPLAPLRRRIQVNMRNHRKITVVDGRVAFTGGLNLGNEYLGEVPLRLLARHAFAIGRPGRGLASARLCRGLGFCRPRAPEGAELFSGA